MELVRIEMTNFTNYAEASLDLTGLELAALVGVNGAGKSSIIDAFLWALFGEATKGGTKALDNYVRRGEQECRVAVEIAIHGERYRVIRQRSISKSKTSLEMYTWTSIPGSEPGWEAISAKNVSDTQAAIERLLRMDYRTFTASSLILQGKSDSLTADMTDQERKEVLARILGLDLWDRLQEVARERTREARATARAVEDLLAQAQAQADRRAVVEQALTDQGAALSETTGTVAQATDQVIELEGKLRQVPALRQQSIDITQQISARERDLQQAGQDVQRLDKEIELQGHLLARRGQFEAELPEAERRHVDAKQAFESLNAQVTEVEVQVRQTEEAHTQAADLDRQITSRERDAAQVTADGQTARTALQEQQGIVDRAVAIREAAAKAAVLAEEIRLGDVAAGQYADLDRQARAIETQVDAWDRATATEMAGLTAQLSSVSSQAATLDQVPCGPELQSRCPLLTGARLAVAEVATLRDRLGQLQTAQNPSVEDWMRLCVERDRLGYSPEAHQTVRQNLLRVQTEAQQLPLLEAAEKRVEEGTAQIESLRTRLSGLRAELTDLRSKRQAYQGAYSNGANLKLALDGLKQRLATSRQAEEDARDRLSRIRQALEDATSNEEAVCDRLQQLQGRLAETHRRAGELEEEIRVLRARQSETAAALVALNEIPGTLAAARAVLDDAKRKEGEIRDLIGRLKQELAGVERAEGDAAIRRRQLASAEREAQVYEIIDQATGKKGGVPALILESAVPQIEALANDLLGRMAGGRLQIRLDTQAEGKSTGTMQEVLRITVLDGGVDGPYVTYSGAERFMVDLSLRIALSKFLAHRSGAEIKLLVLDEGLGALDGANRMQVMAAIHEAAREFSRVLVITHIAELQEALPQRIEVTRGTDGSSIKVVA